MKKILFILFILISFSLSFATTGGINFLYHQDMYKRNNMNVKILLNLNKYIETGVIVGVANTPTIDMAFKYKKRLNNEYFINLYTPNLFKLKSIYFYIPLYLKYRNQLQELRYSAALGVGVKNIKIEYGYHYTKFLRFTDFGEPEVKRKTLKIKYNNFTFTYISGAGAATVKINENKLLILYPNSEILLEFGLFKF